MPEQDNKFNIPTVLDLIAEKDEVPIEDYYALGEKIYNDFDIITISS